MGRIEKQKRQLINEANKRMLGENWKDTSWEDDDGKITIGDIVDYIGDNVRNISVVDLQNKLKSQHQNYSILICRCSFAGGHSDTEVRPQVASRPIPPIPPIIIVFRYRDSAKVFKIVLHISDSVGSLGDIKSFQAQLQVVISSRLA